MNYKSIVRGFVALLFLLIIGCEYEQRPLVVLDNDTTQGLIVSFVEDIIPRFEARCTTSECHDGVTSETELVSPVLTADTAYYELWNGGYIDTANPENSILYQTINDDITDEHYTHATDEDRAYILKWIEEGAFDN